VSPAACAAISDAEGYRESIVLEMPMVQAHQAKAESPPFDSPCMEFPLAFAPAPAAPRSTSPETPVPYARRRSSSTTLRTAPRCVKRRNRPISKQLLSETPLQAKIAGRTNPCSRGEIRTSHEETRVSATQLAWTSARRRPSRGADRSNLTDVRVRERCPPDHKGDPRLCGQAAQPKFSASSPRKAAAACEATRFSRAT
jgi:hypothetical protein